MNDINLDSLPPADWIWCAGDPDSGAQVAQFRLRFTAQAPVCWVGFADTFYSISCNGVHLGMGPILAIHTQPYLSQWDLTPCLQAGDNSLLIEVWFEGREGFTSDADPWQAGLLGWLCTPHAIIPTGAQWQARAWGSFTRASESQRSFAAKRIIIADFRGTPNPWQTATVLGRHPQSPRHTLRTPRDFPTLSQTVVRPSALIDAGICSGDAPVVMAEDVATRMWEQSQISLLRPHWPFSVLSVDEQQGTAWGFADPARMAALGWADQTTGFSGPLMFSKAESEYYLCWDFGRQTSGSLWLDIDAGDNAVIDAGYADHLHQGRVHPRLQGHAYADRLLLPAGRHTVHLPVERGFRYLQLSCRDVNVLHDVRLEEHVFPHDDVIRYRCSDDTLNSIWDMAVATLHQCSLTSHVDNARRERQGWGGPDFYAMLHGFFHAFGDSRLSRKQMQDNLDIFAAHGFIPNWCPVQRPALRWISAHDLWFPLICRDYLWQSGDSELLEPMLQASETVLCYYGQTRVNGLIGKAHDGACRWVEWNMNSAQQVSTWENLLAAAGWRALADMMRVLNISSAEAESHADALVDAINSHLWHPRHQALAQGTRDDGQLVDFCAQLDNAFALLHNLLPEERTEQVLRFCGGRSGTWPTTRGAWQGHGQGERVRYDPRLPVVAGTPFASSICAQAIHRFVSPEDARHYLRYNFGAMLDEGEGTLWEMWPVHQREDVAATCFSQGYGSHVTSTMIACLLGVTFDVPGGRRLRWRPRPCGLAWQEGQVETMLGTAYFRIEGDEISSHLPDGVTLIIDE